jgi:hypothetical protein
VLLSPETWPTLAEEEDKWARTRFKELESELQRSPPPGADANRQGRVFALTADRRRAEKLICWCSARMGGRAWASYFIGSVAEKTFPPTRLVRC